MFSIADLPDTWPGLEAKSVRFSVVAPNPLSGIIETRSAFGRAVLVDLSHCELGLFPFYDLINASLGNDAQLGCCTEPRISLGTTVKDFVEGSCRQSAPGGKYASDVRRCVFATNPLHTNYVRPNGFVVVGGHLVCKPARYDAIGMDCSRFMPLDGPYTAFVMRDDTAKVATVAFGAGSIATNVQFAISGPALVRSEEDVSGQLPYRPRPGATAPYGVPYIGDAPPPFLKLPPGPTQGDEVNYPPPTTMASFTAIGVREDNRIVLVSMFEELRGQGCGCNQGMTVYEVAALLREPKLRAKDAILGGGGADTQQFLRGGEPQFLGAPVRARSPQQGPRAEVEGPRGLGVILAVLAKPTG